MSTAVVDETATVTRQQLVEAIEAGIRRIGKIGLDSPAKHALAALRGIGREAQRVGVGSYVAGCPIAQAFPRCDRAQWHDVFAVGYDRAMREVVGVPVTVNTVEIVQ